MQKIGRPPFQSSLLTTAVSLEAILLTVFVLMLRNHLTILSDRRAHLDLQGNLLAQREVTAMLKAVCLISHKIGEEVTQAQQLANRIRREVEEVTRLRKDE